MGECGCQMNDDRYRLPGPGSSFYLLTLYGGCRSCAEPANITIELITKDNAMYASYLAGEFNQGELPLKRWVDTDGASFQTGHDRSQFIKAMTPHLVGIDSRQLGGSDGTIDHAGAEVIADEMFEDSQIRPIPS